MFEAVSRARRHHHDIGILGMKIDDEPAIGEARVETNHCVHAPAAQTRHPATDLFPIHFIDLLLFHYSVHGISARFHGVLFSGYLDTTADAIDRGKPINEIVAILTESPDKNRELPRQKRVNRIFQSEPEQYLTLDLEP